MGGYVKHLGLLSNDLTLRFSTIFRMYLLEKNELCSSKGAVNFLWCS